MAEEKRIAIKKPLGFNCFVCGTANPIGLDLQFYRAGDSVCADITLSEIYEGWQNMAHGGITSALLDEVMSWAIMYSKRVFLMTRSMNIKYIKPVLIGTPLTVKGKLVDDSEPPKMRARAEIRDHTGKLLVKSSGEFVVIPEDRLPLVPDKLKKEMRSLFERFESTAIG